MRINQTSNWARRITIGIMFLFTALNTMVAENFSKYVGQSFILPIPKCPVNNGAVNSWSYSCSSTNISITNRGSSNPSEAVITKYFDGTLYIECFFQYIYYVNNVPRAGTSTETHRITCNSNNISISAPKSTLTVGETMQMTYRFSHSTFDATPQITWQSSSSAVAINSSSGYVEARASGTAKIQARSNLGNNIAEYTIYVQKLDPTTVSITTTQSEVYCDEGLQLRATVYPSGASQSVTWSMVEGNSSIATLSSSGYLKGVSKGKVTVKATAENGVSTTKSFSIVEPPFTFSNSSPSNNSNSASAFTKPTVTFSHDIYEGSNYSAICLKDNDSGTTISGSVSKSGRTITFNPIKALQPQTNYVFTIPVNAIKNKWGTHNSSALNITFTTGDLEKLTLRSSVTDKFLLRGDRISLTASKSSAKIYYTLNGSTPTTNSTLYTEPIVFENDIKLRAIAIGDGYENSDVLSVDYYLSNVDVVKRYPDTDTQLYVYEYVNPSITFSNEIEASDNINNVSVLKNDKDEIDGDVIVSGRTIYFIPNAPLELGCTYKVTIPQNAIVTCMGEENKAASWTFSTGDFITDIFVGNEVSAAIKTDGSLVTWGEMFKSGNTTDGGYLNETVTTPETFISNDIASVSAGYMHNAVIKTDGTLWMWGRQYCGEFGNNSTVPSASLVKVLDDVATVSCGGQTSAIVKTDGTLWMAGRNDFGQIGDNSIVVRKSPVQILEDVKMAVAGWGASYAIKSDGTLMAWGRNDKGQLGDGTSTDQLVPTAVMDDVRYVATSSMETNTAVAIKSDGSLWIWGNGNATPEKILDDVSRACVGVGCIVAVKNDGTLWKYSNSAATQIADGISDAQVNASSLVVLKKDGSVWSGTPDAITDKMIEGRSSSKLAGLSLNCSTLQMSVDERSVLVAEPSAENADYASLTWESSDESVIEVTDRGVVTAISLGNADITATITDNSGQSYKAVCHVTSGNLGDVNGDGKVTMADAVATMEYYLRWTSTSDEDKKYDVNHDGKITMADGVEIMNIYLTTK